MRAKTTITRVRLTKTAVAALPPSKSPYWDLDLTGFGVRVSDLCTRTYFVQKRLPDGRQCKPTYRPSRSLDSREGARSGEGAARADCRGHRSDSRAESRQTGRKEAHRGADRPRPARPYIEEHAKRRKRLRSVQSDRSLINKHVLPELGQHKVADVTHDDADRLHRKITATPPIAANRAASLGSKAFNLAIKWGWRQDNPFKGIERNPEERRERYLNPAELERLCDALNRRHGKLEAAAIEFLMLTGARRGEALTARWCDFDPGSGVWIKPSAHTKQRRTHRIPLSAAARTVLVRLAEQFASDEPPPDAYVFGGPETIERVRRTWEAVRKEARLPGLRLHDLRHAYASVLASGGLSLPIIAALLGHTTPVTTARYAHLLDDPLRQATERVGRLWTALSDGAKGEVVPLSSGGQG